MSRRASDHVTPQRLYLNRRRFLALGAGSLVSAAAAMACARQIEQESAAVPAAPAIAAVATPTWVPGPTPTVDAREPSASATADELGNSLTPYQQVVGYTNFYELSTDKQLPSEYGKDFVTYPWQVTIDGLVDQPRTVTIDELWGLQAEEHILRMRCVEGWAMVIPWLGFPLSRLLETVSPTAEAKYVRFETVVRPDQLRGQGDKRYDWPYVEGLRLDEAMHPLTLLATGLYGKHLTPQNGAPLRIVVPWKYGFKSIKSIVHIELVAEQPSSTWMKLSPQEYGFWANVNPDVSHPRWSQASERLIGEAGRRATVIYNGYGDQVADLYEGMDGSIFY